MNPEQSRRVDAALDQLRSLQRPNPHQPVLLDTRGSTARVAHLEETVATPEIKPPDEEFDRRRTLFPCRPVLQHASSRHLQNR